MSVTLEPHDADRQDASQNDHKSKGYASKNTLVIFRCRFRRRRRCRRRFRRRVDFCQTLSVNGHPLDLLDQPLLLDMIFLGTHQLCGGVYIFFFCKVSFEKHPNAHAWLKCMERNSIHVILCAGCRSCSSRCELVIALQ